MGCCDGNGLAGPTITGIRDLHFKCVYNVTVTHCFVSLGVSYAIFP